MHLIQIRSINLPYLLITIKASHRFSSQHEEKEEHTFPTGVFYLIKCEESSFVNPILKKKKKPDRWPLLNHSDLELEVDEC